MHRYNEVRADAKRAHLTRIMRYGLAGRSLLGEGDEVQDVREHTYDFEVTLIVRCIEDALEILQAGDPLRWPPHYNDKHSRWHSKSLETCRAMWKEALHWFFYEIDPLGDRVFSLNWCVGALNAFLGLHLDPDAMREQALRAGLLPKRLSLDFGVSPIRPLNIGGSREDQ